MINALKTIKHCRCLPGWESKRAHIRSPCGVTGIYNRNERMDPTIQIAVGRQLQAETHWFKGQKKGQWDRSTMSIFISKPDLMPNSKISEPTTSWISPLKCLNRHLTFICPTPIQFSPPKLFLPTLLNDSSILQLLKLKTLESYLTPVHIQSINKSYWLYLQNTFRIQLFSTTSAAATLV